MKITFQHAIESINAFLMMVALTPFLAPSIAQADIYMQQDTSEQIVLTNLLIDSERTNQRVGYELLIENDIRSPSKSENTLAMNNHSNESHGLSRQQVSEAVASASAQTSIDPALIHAVIRVESNYNTRAVSRRGAQGLMQLMPSTARRFNVTNPYDPAQNVLAGAQYLRELHTLFNGNMPLILAAYNAGPKAVSKNHMRIPPFMETRLYVPKVLDAYRRIRAERIY
ncbi:MAG: lytic transglycosylase domain-containing protein [Burkholderiaceae bacterium]|nr:lytic transglycosylase domain-containing protein [Burkholderiaceae bacterium]